MMYNQRYTYSHIRGFLKKLNFIHTDRSSHVETVALLSKLKVDNNIRIELDEVDLQEKNFK